MKSTYKYITAIILVLVALNFSFAQRGIPHPIRDSLSRDTLRFTTLIPRKLLDFKKADFRVISRYDITLIRKSRECCSNVEVPDFTFTDPALSALKNHEASQLAAERDFYQWLDRQYGILEEEIENQLGQQFSNFGEAQKEFFKDFEMPNVRTASKALRPKFDGKVNVKKNIRDRCLRNIKLLDFRANEINSGIINNSKYGHLKLGTKSLSEITSIAQINTLRNQEIGMFSENQWRLEQEQKIQNQLNNELANLDDLNHDILEELAQTQVDYFNGAGNDFEKLDHMQQYLLSSDYWNNATNYVSEPPYNWFKVHGFGNQDFVEPYVWRNNPPQLSIFHDGYWNLRIQSDPWNTNYWLRQREHARTAALNNALGEFDLAKALADGLIAGLGPTNGSYENYIKKRPTLKAELENYFKLNDYSKLSHDCANYLLNQYLQGGDFTLGKNYYASAGTPEFNSPFNPNIAIGTDLNAIAKQDEFTYLNNVLAALLNDSVHRPEYKGQIIREVFQANGVNVPQGIDNAMLSNYFNFAPTGADNMRIDHARGHGVKENLDQYLKDLKAFHEDVQDMLQNAPTGMNQLAYVDYENRIAEVLNFTNDDGAIAIADMFTNEVARNNFLKLEHHQAITNSAHDILETGFAEGLEFRKLDPEGIRVVAHEAAEISAIDDIAEDVGQNGSGFWPQNAEEWSAFGEMMVPLIGEIVIGFTPAGDYYDLIISINSGDVLGASLAISGIIISSTALGPIKGAIKGARAFRKTIKIYRKLRGVLGAVSKAAKKGFKVFLDASGQLIVKKGDQIIAQGDDAVRRFLTRFDNFSKALDNTIDSFKRGARFDLNGTGKFKDVRGHHPMAKKSFEGEVVYNANEAFSVSANTLGGQAVHNAITGNQNRLYSAWKRANPNKRMEINDMANIELQAMIDARIPENIARGWVVKALEDLKEQGVSEITRIPWNGINP
ncbi:hypothetical protein [Algibacter sp. 2305UL17-15]|uniref:hypothetical protein n=1 Tax=Algibacter sp. 2305UL17-15 TaxID=3231268 RepID=UPI00345A4407